MMGRVAAISRYLFTSSVGSLAGLIYITLSFAFVYLFFLAQRTPDADYYVLVIGTFGAIFTFLITLTVAGRANKQDHAPWLTLLPSRIEFLAAVLLASLLFSTLLQALVAAIAIIGEPELTLRLAIEIPPAWIAANILVACLALHATDLVARNWSRVYIYGLLLLFLFGSTSSTGMARWMSGRFRSFATFLSGRGIASVGNWFSESATWLLGNGSQLFEEIFGIIFWPFHAIFDATLAGFYSGTQALAPAFLLIYATILFLLAADLFANKDLQFSE